ncbi:hypothetical protein KC356_g101 [Hortaea werneckii]|nr:hypothetical protein KC356_g101 [Hortaea werneckii]
MAVDKSRTSSVIVNRRNAFNAAIGGFLPRCQTFATAPGGNDIILINVDAEDIYAVLRAKSSNTNFSSASDGHGSSLTRRNANVARVKRGHVPLARPFAKRQRNNGERAENIS